MYRTSWFSDIEYSEYSGEMSHSVLLSSESGSSAFFQGLLPEMPSIHVKKTFIIFLIDRHQLQSVSLVPEVEDLD